METRIRTRLTPLEGHRFGLTVGGAFAGLGGLLWWREHPYGAFAAAGLGVLLISAALAFPTRLGPVQSAWMALAKLLSKITTPVFMGLVYFGVLTPTGILMRLLGRNPLARRQTASSFWVTREARRPSQMERQF